MPSTISSGRVPAGRPALYLSQRANESTVNDVKHLRYGMLSPSSMSHVSANANAGKLVCFVMSAPATGAMPA